MFSGCAGHTMDIYKETTPQADIKTYFNGPIKGWGIIQDWRGRVVSRFDVQMVGKWEGDEGTLTEDFVYYDTKKTQQRIWKIKKMAEGRYEGTASDILGIAKGETLGSAVRWNYVMDLDVDGSTYRIRFDDWMWAMNDGVVVNRSYLKKFGFTVAELTLFMQKQTP
ncbi:MAG: DUF3833 domain-containing protein [Alphaproteobacteria bacterium]